MRAVLRHRPSPAMVVACIALAVALGGTSYAAIKLPKNSVGAKQLKKNAVTPVKVKANAISSPKVANNSLTGADINEATLATVPSATNATNATNAAAAANANALGGIPATGFLRSTNEGGGALAGANVNSNGTVNAHFNRFGGAPTVSHGAGSGSYTITFPGLEGKLFNSTVVHIATLISIGEIRATSAGGNPTVFTSDSGGNPADRGFYYVVYGTNLAPAP
jgi:hypothetical protein